MWYPILLYQPSPYTAPRYSLKGPGEPFLLLRETNLAGKTVIFYGGPTVKIKNRSCLEPARTLRANYDYQLLTSSYPVERNPRVTPIRRPKKRPLLTAPQLPQGRCVTHIVTLYYHTNFPNTMKYM